jgi:hypothetical protein
LILWKNLVIDYHRAMSQPIFNPNTAPIFQNPQINRNNLSLLHAC